MLPINAVFTRCVGAFVDYLDVGLIRNLPTSIDDVRHFRALCTVVLTISAIHSDDAPINTVFTRCMGAFVDYLDVGLI